MSAAWRSRSRVAFRPNGTTSIGSGKRPRRRHMLRAVGDDDHAAARRRHDFFAQMSAAPPPLIRRSGIVDFVGAVDGQIELGRLVESRSSGMPSPVRACRVASRGRHADDLQAAAQRAPRARRRSEPPSSRCRCPRRMPSVTSAAARSAAARLRSSLTKNSCPFSLFGGQARSHSDRRTPSTTG